MLSLHKFMFPLLAPADTVEGVVDNKMSKDEVIKFLGEEDEEVDKPLDLKEKIEKDLSKGKEKEEDESEPLETKSDEDEEAPDEEDIELADLEDELDGPSEEQLELVTPVRRAEILKKYPQVFKDFPYLEKAYYREQQYTEIFPTIDDAKEAVSSRETLDHFEEDLISGNTEKILSSLKTTNPNSFIKVVDDYLPTLARVDEKSYHHVIGNILSHTIHQMVAEGKRGKNEALEAAAQILNQFAFGTSEYVAPKKLHIESDEDKPDDKSTELARREQEITQREFTKARDEINTRVNNVLKATIDGNIDTKESMTPYVKKNASREAMELITELIEKDSRFKTILDKQWEIASKNDFDKTSMERIRQTCITKAKTLLPSVIKKARNEALRGIGKRVKDDSEDVDTERTERNAPIKTKGREAAPVRQGPKSTARPLRKGESTADYLLSDD